MMFPILIKCRYQYFLILTPNDLPQGEPFTILRTAITDRDFEFFELGRINGANDMEEAIAKGSR